MLPPLNSPPDLRSLVRVIAQAHADCVMVGAVAMAVHGSTYATADLDICYRRDTETVRRLCDALEPHRLFLRSASLDIREALLTQDMSLDTDYGQVDLLGELGGIGTYEQVLALSQPFQINGSVVMVLGLDGIIQSKESVNRDKDQLHLTELKALRALRDSRSGDEP